MSQDNDATDSRGRDTKLVISLVRLLAVVAVLAAVHQMVFLIRGYGIGLNMADPPLELTYLPQIRSAVRGPGNDFTVPDLPVYVRVLCGLPGLLQGVMLGFAAHRLIRILRAVSRGRSFTGEVRRDLASISLVLVLGGLAMILLDVLAVWRLHLAVYSPGPGDWVDWTSLGTNLPSVPIFLIALGFVASAFMYAIRDGARLEKETEGVV